MNPVGPGNPARIVLPTAVRLRVGRILSVRVVERLAGGRVRLEIDGKTLTARANAPLAPGDHARVYVKGIDDHGRVILELLREGESPLLRSMELPQDGSHRAALEAFVRSGLPLDPSAIAGTARRIRSEGPDGAYLARLIAILRAKGLPARIADEIIALSGRGTGNSSDDRHGDREREHGHERRTRAGSDAKRAGKRPPGDAGSGAAGADRSTTDSGRRLAAAIRSVVETPASTVTPIHLLNHYREGTAHWTLIPLAVEPFDAVTLAVRCGYTGTVDRVTLRVSRGETRYQASWNPSGGPISIMTNAPEAARTAASMMAQLSEALQPLGLIPREPLVTHRLDGFSDEPVEHILRTVDKEV